MKNKSFIQNEREQLKLKNQNIDKKNNNNNLDNNLSYSNILISNNFYKNKEKKSKEKTKENEKSKSTIENKSLDFPNLKMNVNNIIVDNKFLIKKGLKEKVKKIDNDVALYQDFVIDGYKNALVNSKKNVIERLGDCIEKKYQTIEFWKHRKNPKIPKEKLFDEYKKFQKVMIGTGYLNDNNLNPINENRYYYTTHMNKKMKQSYSTSNILDKKNSGDFPLLLSTPISYIKKFSSFSEKERNEKNFLALLRLKHFLSMFWKKRKEIVKEFFNKFNIKEPFFYKVNNLDNFANYINDNINDDNDLNQNNSNIETRLPMIEIILKGIKYKSYLNIKKNDNKEEKKIKLKKNKNLSTDNLNYSNDELSEEKEYLDSLITKEKISKYKSFLDRNYKTSVNNRLLKGLTKEEKLNYFSKKKFGKVEIRDKNNLANNLEKQAFYDKRFNLKSNKYFNKSSIKYYNDEDLKRLNDELNCVSNSIVKKFESERLKNTHEKILGAKKYRGLNEKIVDKLNQRLYYTIKEKYHLNHPEVIPTQKKKLLEYIIVQKLQERKNFEEKLLNDIKSS